MAETVSLTKSINGDYELIIGGYLAETFQFPRFEYVTNAVGVKLKVYNGRQPMKRFYKPSEWAINYETGFTTNKEVTDAISSMVSLNELIKSLNPIFWIEDMTEVVGGKLVDKSGNNTQIAVSTVNEVNDTITMPASNTAIINALKADGMYYFFYTNDTTPKAVRIGGIMGFGSRRLYSYYLLKNFCLFSNSPTLTQQNKLYEYLSISKSWLPDVNIAKQSNYHVIRNLSPVVGGEFGSIMYNYTDTIESNSLSNSVSKKTQKASIVTPATLNTPVLYNLLSTGGRYKFSFWHNKTELGSRNLVAYSYIAKFGNLTLWNGGLAQNLSYTAGSKGTAAGYEFTVKWECKEVSGDWARIEIEFFASNNGDQNRAAFGTCDFKMGLIYGTPIQQDLHYTDTVIVKDYESDIVGTSLLDGPYEKMNSKMFGKTLCAIGDSITQGGWYLKWLQHSYGLSKIYNCGKSGRRMYNDGSNGLYQDIATVVAQPAEIFTILASANDNNSPVGSINDTTAISYLGGYNQYLTYLLANIPDVANKKIVLITCPFTVGTGNTIAQGKALYQQKFIDMANGVKALGVKYNLPVIDLHGLMPMTFENSGIFLGDKTHWNTALDIAAGDIIGKGLNDLY